MYRFGNNGTDWGFQVSAIFPVTSPDMNQLGSSHVEVGH